MSQLMSQGFHTRSPMLRPLNKIRAVSPDAPVYADITVGLRRRSQFPASLPVKPETVTR